MSLFYQSFQFFSSQSTDYAARHGGTFTVCIIFMSPLKKALACRTTDKQELLVLPLKPLASGQRTTANLDPFRRVTPQIVDHSSIVFISRNTREINKTPANCLLAILWTEVQISQVRGPDASIPAESLSKAKFCPRERLRQDRNVRPSNLTHFKKWKTSPLLNRHFPAKILA